VLHSKSRDPKGQTKYTRRQVLHQNK
jgi:hypothetical protein